MKRFASRILRELGDYGPRPHRDQNQDVPPDVEAVLPKIEEMYPLE